MCFILRLLGIFSRSSLVFKPSLSGRSEEKETERDDETFATRSTDMDSCYLISFVQYFQGLPLDRTEQSERNSRVQARILRKLRNCLHSSDRLSLPFVFVLQSYDTYFRSILYLSDCSLRSVRIALNTCDHRFDRRTSPHTADFQPSQSLSSSSPSSTCWRRRA